MGEDAQENKRPAWQAAAGCLSGRAKVWPGQLGFEQAENFKFALVERLDEGLCSRGGEERGFDDVLLLPLPAVCRYSLV